VLVHAPARLRLRGLLDRRFAVRVRCAEACSVSARLLLDAASARRASLTRAWGRARVGGGSQRRTTARSFNVTITLTRRTLKAMKRLRRGTLRLRIGARGATRNATIERTIAYRR
jgi:hypothetical protein